MYKDIVATTSIFLETTYTTTYTAFQTLISTIFIPFIGISILWTLINWIFKTSNNHIEKIPEITEKSKTKTWSNKDHDQT